MQKCQGREMRRKELDRQEEQVRISRPSTAAIFEAELTYVRFCLSSYCESASVFID